MNYENKYLFTIKNKKGLYIDLIEQVYTIYFPDGVWTHIKEYAFNRIEYLTKLRNKLLPISRERKDLYRFGDSRTTYYHERKLYYLYIGQQVEDIDDEIYRRTHLIN